MGTAGKTVSNIAEQPDRRSEVSGRRRARLGSGLPTGLPRRVSLLAVALLLVAAMLSGCASESRREPFCNEVASRALERPCGIPLSRLIASPEPFSGTRVEVSGFMLSEGEKGVVLYPDPSLPNRADRYSCVIVWTEGGEIDWGSISRKHGVYFATVAGDVILDGARRSCSAALGSARISDVSPVGLHEDGGGAGD